MRQDVLRSDQLTATGVARPPDTSVDTEARALRDARRGSLGAMAWVIGSWVVAFVAVVLVVVAVR